jgi:hypothetical protein
MPAEYEAQVREIARQEIASLAGLALRRSQEMSFTRSPDRNMAIEAVHEEAAKFWGEVLADFSGHTGSGETPGAE